MRKHRMKKSLFSPVLILFIFSILYLPITFAQDISQFSLPEGAKARFGKGYVNQIQYSPDGTHLAVVSSIGIWIYDTTTYQEVGFFAGHMGDVTCIAFSPDGKTLASGSVYNIVRLWDMETGRYKRTLKGHRDAIYSVAFSPDGSTVAGGSTGKREGNEIFGAQILIWDAATGKRKRTLIAQGQVNSLAFSSDGKILASGEAWPGYAVQLWDANTGKRLRTLAGHTDWVNNVAFAPNKRMLASASRDGTILIWNADTGKQEQILSENKPSVNIITFSPDGSMLASGGQGKNIDLWDVATGKHRHTLTLTDSERVTSIVFNTDGKTLASVSHGGNPIRIWDVATWTHKHTLIGYTYPVIGDIAFSSDESTLASGSGYLNIYLWNVATGKHEVTLIGHTYPVGCLAFNPNGQTLASGGYDSTVFLWDVVTKAKKKMISPKQRELVYSRCAAFSSDMNMFTAGSSGTVQLWDVTKGELIRTFQGHRGYIYSVAFSPDGKLLATGSNVEHIGEDHSFGYKGVRLWDVESGEQKGILKGKMGDIYSVVFSPDGLTLASGEGWPDYAIRLWDVGTLEQKQILKGHTKNVSSVAFNSEGSMLASGSADNTIRLWDVNTGTHKRTLTGHTGNVNSVIFSVDGNMLASGSYDGTVLLWDIAVSDDKK